MREATLGWERALIGSVLYDPEMMEEATELLPSDFTGGHQLIWQEMLSLHNKNGLDLRGCIEALRSRDVLDQLTDGDGEEYLEYLISRRGTAIATYVDEVGNAALKRELSRVAALIRIDAESENVSAQDAADEAERRLMDLRRMRGVSTGATLSQLLSVFNTRITDMRNGDVQPAWTPRISAIQDVVGFVDEQDFIIVAARPGDGKSSVMRFEFLKAASEGTPVVLFNLENGELEYAKFAISLETGINSDRLRDPSILTPEEMNKVREASEKLARLPLYIKTMGAPSVAEIKRVANQHVSRNGVKLIGLDYIQLVRNGISRRVDDVGETTAVLRGMAMNIRVPVVANSQLSRDIVHRGVNAEPNLADLRDSGTLEQDATGVWFQRHLWSEPTAEQIGQFPQNRDQYQRVLPRPVALPVCTHVLKNRNGSIGRTDPYLWVKSTNNFLPLERLEDRL